MNGEKKFRRRGRTMTRPLPVRRRVSVEPVKSTAAITDPDRLN